MASSSAVMAPPDQKYDVFLSFRGEDTRDKFTSHLHAALKRKKIDTYMDNRLERGDEIGSALMKAIEQSKLSVIIFSRNYASSPWCLRELVHILACRERNDQFVIPVFYDIDPSHVRKQEDSYGEAIAKMEERFKDSMDIVHEWKNALTTAANLSGFDSQKIRPESELVEKIVKEIWTKLNCISSSDLKGLVGMERHIEQIESLLCIHAEDVHITVGIWGLGGIGKTTLADVIFNKLSSRFDACSFLANVREKSEKGELDNLRNDFLRELLKEKNLSISTPSIPTYMIERLSRTKALVVLDDVDASNQLEYLLGDKVVFGSGSRVIITSRSKRILKEKVAEHHLYQMEGFEFVDALELFQSKAFKDRYDGTDYADLSRRRIQRIEELLCIHAEDVHFRTVGIWGMGGLGKTTLAGVVFKQLSSQFEACSFLAKVRENSEKVGLINLRNELLRELLKEENLRKSAPSIPTYMIERLSRTKALVVLDDVDASNQLEYLLGDKVVFGSGSRVIITSRNKCILKEKVEEHHLYQMEGLEFVDYADLSRRVVDHAAGLPLALKVLGSCFLHCNNKKDWEEELNNLEGDPNREIQNLLSISYNGLNKNAKGIFLDIACFYKGMPICDAEKMLEMQGFCVQIGISFLVDMSFLSISKNNTVEMHDLLQQMGRSIVREGFGNDLGKQSRFWDAEDVYRLLKYYTGTATDVEAIFLDMRQIRELQLSPTTFRNMNNLRLLNFFDPSPFSYSGPPYGIVKVHVPGGLESLPEDLRYLRWDGYPLKSLPLGFSPRNLIELHMPSSKLEKLWDSGQNLKKLKDINLSYSEHLTEIPDLSKCSPHIERINLLGCRSLIEVPSFENLDKLTYLNLVCCVNLKTFSKMPCNIRFLDLSGCEHLTEVPDLSGCLNIETIQLRDCTSLVQLPTYFQNLDKLKTLDVYKCPNLTTLPGIPCNLEFLNVFLCPNLKSVPESILISNSRGTLRIQWSDELKKLLFPVDHSSSRKLGLNHRPVHCRSSSRKLDLNHYKMLAIPDSFICSSSLEEINLEGSMIENIPASIKKVSGLRILNLKNCRNLQSLPELPVRLECLTADGCRSLKAVTSSMTAVILQGDQNQYEDPYFHRESLTFTDCLELDESAKNSILTDTQIKIMQMASSRLVTRQRHVTGSPEEDSVTMIYPGNEMPGWFNCHTEGCTINVKFPPGWFHTTNFLGFALCVVIAFHDRPGWVSYILSCKCKFKTHRGKVYQDLFKASPMLVSLSRKESPSSIDTHHVLAFFNKRNHSNEGNNNPIPFDKVTEASFHFYPSEPAELKVRKCGIRMLYTNDSGLLSLVMATGEVAGTTDKEANNVVASDDEGLVMTFWRRWARMMTVDFKA